MKASQAFVAGHYCFLSSPFVIHARLHMVHSSAPSTCCAVIISASGLYSARATSEKDYNFGAVMESNETLWLWHIIHTLLQH